MSPLGLQKGFSKATSENQGPSFPPPPASPQVEVRKVQANVENQMLIINSDSQRHRGQVAFLLVRLAHPLSGPGFPPSAPHLAEGHPQGLEWMSWGPAVGNRMPRQAPGHNNGGWGSELPPDTPSGTPPPTLTEIDPDNTR